MAGIVALIRRSTFAAFSCGSEEDFDAVELAVHVEKALGGGDVDADPFGVLIRGDGADGEVESLVAAFEFDRIAFVEVQAGGEIARDYGGGFESAPARRTPGAESARQSRAAIMSMP